MYFTISIFDIIGEHEGILDYSEQLNRACEIYGIRVDTSFSVKKEKSRKQYKNEQYKQNFRDFFLEAHKNIKKTDYPETRGLSEGIIRRFKLGYISNWKHPKVPNSIPIPRLIIPITEYKKTSLPFLLLLPYFFYKFLVHLVFYL